MELVKLGPDASADEVLDVLRRDGGVIVTGLMTPEQIREVNDELAPHIGRTPTGEGRFFGRRTRRTGAIFRRARSTHALGAHPLVVEVIEAILLPHCSSIQVNGTQLIQIGPGEPEQVLHADDELWPVPKNGAEFMVNSMWALSDFTRENGATRMIPGSHKVQASRTPDDSELAWAEMPAGSVVLWLGSVMHGGGANNSALPRTGLSIGYSLGWLRQVENQYLANPPEVARTYPEDLQRLVGYQVHMPNLGCYEGQDPHVVLEGDEMPDTLAFKDYLPDWASELVESYYAEKEAAREQHRQVA